MNKKTLLVILLAALLAFLFAILIFNTGISKKTETITPVSEQAEELPLQAPAQEETKNEETTAVVKQEQTPAKQSVKQPVKKVSYVKKTTKPQVKAETPVTVPEPAQEEKTTAEQAAEPDNAIVIPVEYKFKTPSKYVFK